MITPYRQPLTQGVPQWYSTHEGNYTLEMNCGTAQCAMTHTTDLFPQLWIESSYGNHHRIFIRPCTNSYLTSDPSDWESSSCTGLTYIDTYCPVTGKNTHRQRDKHTYIGAPSETAHTPSGFDTGSWKTRLIYCMRLITTAHGST